ncbi:response regulator transcription factor [Adhaeribacter swui]|uniref:Response regulator transcription factor n=1 Tax=Adhaeribacter swui TaxID=2086471 RepID=A0A7G7GB66_9BACT|nr:response regulator transcription factor [Adhaeribacter swui]QNF34400.1 response regulator transcription factor [Adhaeribacter swui]
MIQCLIVDDEPLAQQILENHILQTPQLQLVQKCANSLEAFEVIHREKIDLLFLDIRMPILSGIEFIQSLKNPPAFIFTTAFSEYAVMSYELQAVDYLLKPITYERFQVSVAKFLKQPIVPQAEKSYSYFKVNGKLIKVEHAAIIYVQSVKDYLLINTGQSKYITHMTMKSLVELLPSTLFRRVHRSFLINVSHITAISKSTIELGKTRVPVGEKYRQNLLH